MMNKSTKKEIEELIKKDIEKETRVEMKPVKEAGAWMEITVGFILKEIRIGNGITLRQFCLDRKLDAVRYSLIERNELRPNMSELNEYLNLIEEKK